MQHNRRENDGNQYGGYDHGRAPAGYGNQAIVPNNNGLNNVLTTHFRPQGNELQLMLDQVGEAAEVAHPHQYRNQDMRSGFTLNFLELGVRPFANAVIATQNANGQRRAMELDHAASMERLSVARDISVKTIDANTSKALKVAELYDNDQKRVHDQAMKDKDIGLKREKLTHKRSVQESKQTHESALELTKADLANRNAAQAAAREEHLIRVKAQAERELMQAQAALMRGQGVRPRPAPAEEAPRQRGPGFFDDRRRDDDAEEQRGQEYGN